MPPDPEYYRPQWGEGLATWWQVYETVSEGTPVTPPFATREELVEYLVENGDFWDQARRKRGWTITDCAPWSRATAEKFVLGSGCAPSMISFGGRLMSGVEGLALAQAIAADSPQERRGLGAESAVRRPADTPNPSDRTSVTPYPE